MKYQILLNLSKEEREILERLAEKRETNLTKTIRSLIMEADRQSKAQAETATLISLSRVCEKNTNILVGMLNSFICGFPALRDTPFLDPEEQKHVIYDGALRHEKMRLKKLLTVKNTERKSDHEQ